MGTGSESHQGTWTLRVVGGGKTFRTGGVVHSSVAEVPELSTAVLAALREVP